jgi:tight adherence protein B
VGWLFLLLVFLATALAVLAGYFVLADLSRRDEVRARRRALELRQDGSETQSAQAPPLFKSISELDLGALGPPPPQADTGRGAALGWREQLPVRLTRPLREVLARSGLKVSLVQLLWCCAACGAGLGLAGLLSQGLLLGVPALVGGAVAPVVLVEVKRRARQERFLNQLPGAFELMARIIRSGQSVPQAFQAVADSCEDPVAGAFARCREQQNLGLAPEVAFRELAEHTGVVEMRLFAVAMLIQRQAGGNLSEVLERIAGLLRARGRVRRQVHTLTAEGRMQAGILLALPFFLFFALRFVNRSYADALLEQPALLAGTVVSLLVGAWWIRKIVNFSEG